MLLRTVFFAMVSLASTFLYAASHSQINQHTATCTFIKNVDDCKLSGTGLLDLKKTNGKNAKNIFLKVNKMKGELRLYHDQRRGTDFVRGEFLIDNMSREKLYLKYKVILKDKKGIVAQTAGYIHLKNGKRQKNKISYIELGKQDVHNITSYEVRMDVSNQEH